MRVLTCRVGYRRGHSKRGCSKQMTYSHSIGKRLLALSARILLCAAMVALFCTLTGVGLAQSTFGEFVGTVKDPSGALVVGCTVTVKNVGTSVIRTATTDASGSYVVVNLEPG